MFFKHPTTLYWFGIRTKLFRIYPFNLSISEKIFTPNLKDATISLKYHAKELR